LAAQLVAVVTSSLAEVIAQPAGTAGVDNLRDE
jgi:hypothetical protein